MNFENLEINIHDLPDYEEVDFKPISKKYLYVIFFNWIVITVLVLTAFLVFNAVQSDLRVPYFEYVFGFLVVFFILNLAISYFAFFKRKYAIRNHDVIYQYGLIKNTTTIIPFNRIQHVNLEEGWLSRVLDLQTIAIFTAGQNGGDIKIPGLEIGVSKQINQLILNKIKEEEVEEKAVDSNAEYIEEQPEILVEIIDDET